MVRQPEVEPWRPLIGASKLACLEYLPVSHFQNTPTACFHFINQYVAFQNQFRYALFMHALHVTCSC
jgi:hypothetical protein